VIDLSADFMCANVSGSDMILSALDEIMKAADKALYEVKGKQALFKVYEDGQYSWLDEKQIRP